MNQNRSAIAVAVLSRVRVAATAAAILAAFLAAPAVLAASGEAALFTAVACATLIVMPVVWVRVLEDMAAERREAPREPAACAAARRRADLPVPAVREQHLPA